MKRNRSIRTLPLDKATFLKHPLPESSTRYQHEKLYFGEEISKDSSPFFEKNQFLSSDDSDILTSIRDLGNSKSSSSSLSWGEDYKSEASKQVKDELERMDRVLRGLEPIPGNYDEEEYQEWMEFFPNLCVLGTKIGIFIESPNKSKPSKSEELVALYPEPEEICDKLEPSDQSKKAVIAEVAPKITIDVDNYLKVSSLGVPCHLSRRQSSSRSLISSQISSSKWLKDEEYNSLPCLGVGKNVRNGAPKSILKNSLVLPPIEFRSVSATPRQSKSLSALSSKDQKYSGFKRKCK